MPDQPKVLDLEWARQKRAGMTPNERARLILNQAEARRRVRLVRNGLAKIEGERLALERDTRVGTLDRIEELKVAHAQGVKLIEELEEWQRQNDPEALQVKESDDDPEPEDSA